MSLLRTGLYVFGGAAAVAATYFGGKELYKKAEKALDEYETGKLREELNKMSVPVDENKEASLLKLKIK